MNIRQARGGGVDLIARVFLPQAEIPLGVEVAASVKCAEHEDGSGVFRPHLAPVMPILALTSDLHRAFGHAAGEGGVVAQKGCPGEQAVGHN